jgi:hypothetical protein
MTSTQITEVYRVSLGESACRSAEVLAAMLVRDIDGVQVVSIDREGTLLALTSADRDVRDDVVAAVVRAGFAPETVLAAPFERVVQRMPLTLEETVALTAPEPCPEPVRAAVETLQVQRVSVSVTDGYDPAHIVVAAGIPVEITFSEGHGCLAKVMFEQLGIEADLEHGGAIVRLPALDPGDYPFSCGMRMVHGTVTAE